MDETERPPQITPYTQIDDASTLQADNPSSMIEDVHALTLDQIEDIEKLTLRWIFQAMLDFGVEARTIFLNSPDEVKDIAEDITREVLDRLPGYNVPQRVYGTVDYKRARYIILPDMIMRQALFVDSKAEKENRTATIQMSQTSLQVQQVRAGAATNELGHVPIVDVYGGKQYLTTTAFLHFKYADRLNANNVWEHHLLEATLFCLPNGRLQPRYNPAANDTIWLAGRNAPTRGEDFRVRVSFDRLKQKARWRVQKVSYSGGAGKAEGIWDE